MKREALLQTKEYWLIQIQNDLFEILETYMKRENINRTQLAERLNVTKGYISQIFNGDFDHKISKLVDLSLFAGKVPILSFVDIDYFINEDSKDKVFDLIPMKRAKPMTMFEDEPKKNPIIKNIKKVRKNSISK